jgi:hypothetical protein
LYCSNAAIITNSAIYASSLALNSVRPRADLFSGTKTKFQLTLKIKLENLSKPFEIQRAPTAIEQFKATRFIALNALVERITRASANLLFKKTCIKKLFVGMKGYNAESR